MRLVVSDPQRQKGLTYDVTYAVVLRHILKRLYLHPLLPLQAPSVVEEIQRRSDEYQLVSESWRLWHPHVTHVCISSHIKHGSTFLYPA